VLSRVELKQVVKRFGDVTAVKRLNLSIREGEFFTLLGPSGCGKTTILRMIAGFYQPSEGRILFDTNDVTHLPPHRRDTGMVFQNYALFPHMTVMENVAFGLQVRKRPREEIKRRVEEALAQVRLAGYGERRISQLSGGQQQRVALARALVIRPRILLLDEPLSNLDARLRDEMRAEIINLQRSLGITTVYVTHDQTEALSMSDRIAVFNQGVCQQVGTPMEVYNTPTNSFVAAFVGETNLLPCTVRSVTPETVTVSCGDWVLTVDNRPENVASLPDDPEGKPLFASIRPEGIRLTDESAPNAIKGTVTLVQFTGSTLQCTAELEGGITLRALFLNLRRGMERIRKGETLWFDLPKEQIRLVPPAPGGEADG
jgi:iron(III) transport system ATP-binding protein